MSWIHFPPFSESGAMQILIFGIHFPFPPYFHTLTPWVGDSATLHVQYQHTWSHCHIRDIICMSVGHLRSAHSTTLPVKHILHLLNKVIKKMLLYMRLLKNANIAATCDLFNITYSNIVLAKNNLAKCFVFGYEQWPCLCILYSMRQCIDPTLWSDMGNC